MSLQYRPNKKMKPHCPSQYDGIFDANVSGCNLLGALHRKFGLPVFDDPFCTWICRVSYSMDRETAEAASKKLSQVTDDEILAFFHSEPWIKGAWAGSDMDFVGWVRDWQLFLERSEGYNAD